MMLTRRVFPIALAMGMGLGMPPAASEAAKVKDGANMFSASAIQSAEEKLGKLERQYQLPIEVETIPSLQGKKIGDALKAIANAEGRKGLFVLISKEDKKIEAAVSGEYAYAFPFGRTVAIRDGFTEGLKASRNGNFDPGLESGVKATETFVARSAQEHGGTIAAKPGAPRPATAPPAAKQNNAPAAPAPAPRAGGGGGFGFNGILGLLILIFGVMIVFRVIRSLMGGGNRAYGGPNQMGGPGYGGPVGGQGYGGPGYGGPGYGYGGGGGGGGFWSSMFGGIGGAMAGNWLYDKMSGRGHESYGGGTSAPSPGVGYTPEAPQETQWVGSGGGDWGGGDDNQGGGW